jgi:iron complex transport system ATP-binding protein
LRFADLSVTLADKPILENYSLSVGQGDVLAILGANGVGKTTLLNCMSAAKAERRSATVHGRIGYVPQLFHLDLRFLGARHRADGPGPAYRPVRSPRRLDYEIAQKYLDQMKVGHLRDRPFNELSGGQRQLVMIAQALSSECEILVLDEPLLGPSDYKNQSIVVDTLPHAQRRYGSHHRLHHPRAQHASKSPAHRAADEGSPPLPEQGPVDDVLTAGKLSSLYDVAIAKADFAEAASSPSPPSFRHAETDEEDRLSHLGLRQPDHQLPGLRQHLDDMIYLRELETYDLSRYAAVVLPEGWTAPPSGATRRSSTPMCAAAAS